MDTKTFKNFNSTFFVIDHTTTGIEKPFSNLLRMFKIMKPLNHTVQ